MNSLPVVLVIGCGSIGERHIRTFQQTDRCRVVACDVREEVRAAMRSRYRVATVANWQEALAAGGINAAIIATPADSHVHLARESLDRGLDCLIEKPLAIDLEGVRELAMARDRSGRIAAVAYVQRFRPAFTAASDFIRGGSFGRILQATAISGQDFAALRPGYQHVYYRDRATGGGAIQDALTHLVNAIEWILGPTESVFCAADHLALPGVEVEDTVAVIARNGHAIVSYALNQFQAPNETILQFNAGKGSIRIEFAANRWGTLPKGATAWDWHEHPLLARDSLFAAQAHSFLDLCEKKPSMLATLEEGIRAVAFNLAAFESIEKRAQIRVCDARPSRVGINPLVSA